MAADKTPDFEQLLSRLGAVQAQGGLTQVVRDDLCSKVTLAQFYLGQPDKINSLAAKQAARTVHETLKKYEAKPEAPPLEVLDRCLANPPAAGFHDLLRSILATYRHLGRNVNKNNERAGRTALMNKMNAILEEQGLGKEAATPGMIQGWLKGFYPSNRHHIDALRIAGGIDASYAEDMYRICSREFHELAVKDTEKIESALASITSDSSTDDKRKAFSSILEATGLNMKKLAEKLGADRTILYRKFLNLGGWKLAKTSIRDVAAIIFPEEGEPNAIWRQQFSTKFRMPYNREVLGNEYVTFRANSWERLEILRDLRKNAGMGVPLIAQIVNTERKRQGKEPIGDQKMKNILNRDATMLPDVAEIIADELIPSDIPEYEAHKQKFLDIFVKERRQALTTNDEQKNTGGGGNPRMARFADFINSERQTGRSWGHGY